VTPGVVGNRLGGGEDVVLALVVEAFAVLVDYDPVVLAPDNRVGCLRSRVDELGVEHVELAGRAGTYIHRHADANAAVVLDARNDDRTEKEV